MILENNSSKVKQFCHVSIPWSSVSKARGFFGWFFLVAICSFCCLRSHFLLKVETPRMTSGFPPMKICWSRYKLWTTRHRTCLLISFHTVSNGIMTSHALICESRFSYFLTLFPSVNFMLCRLKMGSRKERILWCLLCLRWAKSRLTPLRMLVPRISYVMAAYNHCQSFKTLSYPNVVLWYH